MPVPHSPVSVAIELSFAGQAEHLETLEVPVLVESREILRKKIVGAQIAPAACPSGQKLHQPADFG